MTEEKRALLIENTARHIEPVTENIKYRHAVHCYLGRSTPYGERITAAMGLDLEKVRKSWRKGTTKTLIEATLHV